MISKFTWVISVESLSEPSPDIAADQDRDVSAGRIDLLSQLFEPLADIHRVADDGVIEPVRRADIADRGGAAMDADADGDRRLALRLSPLVVLADRAGDGEGRAAGPLGAVRLLLGRAPEGHHRIADELVDGAILGLYAADEESEMPDKRCNVRGSTYQPTPLPERAGARQTLARRYWMHPRKSMLAGAAVVGLTFAAGSAAAQGGTIVIATGTKTGLYYPTGAAICQLVNKSQTKPAINCKLADTEGSVENLNGIRSGEFQMALAQSDAQAQSYMGSGRFRKKGAFGKLRSVFAVYPEAFTVLARAQANVKSFADLKGKRVIPAILATARKPFRTSGNAAWPE